MSTFDDDERSTRQNRPIDLYAITTPTVTYRLTSHAVDVVYGGNTFTAITMSRGNQQLAQDLTGRELIVYLPITHPLVQRFAATGIPEHGVQVTLQRLQAVSGVAVQAWQGFAGGLSIDGHVATLRVPALTDDAMKIQLPVIAAQKLCNHRLGDIGCAPNPGGVWPNPGGDPGSGGPDLAGSFTVSTTIVSQTIAVGSVTLAIASIGGNPNGWAAYGDVVHTATAQRRLILAQTSTSLTINAPLVGVSPGDAISVIAGCAHDVTTCRDKFNNRINHGGAPQMNNSINPWAPNGFGVIQQV